MGRVGKYEYLRAIRERYQDSTKKMKQPILDEFCLVCGYTRKYAIRKLNGQINSRDKKPGPKKIYSEEVEKHLVILWRAMGLMCSKKMVVALPLWLPYYKDADDRIKSQLLKISASTIDRMLRPYKSPEQRGLSTTKPVSWVKTQIPIELIHSNVTRPGFIEADTVAHCGNSTAGEYANSITMTDLCCGWTENRAVWTKDAERVTKKIKDIEDDLPFPLLGFACDNGTEFLNETLYNYFKNRTPRAVKLVRRRPYKKNDAAHVEQKNWTHVRLLWGYDRIDDESFISLMNEIYRSYWNPLLNFFTPTMKLIKKTRIGAKIKKIYDEPKTPYQRIMDSKDVDMGIKEHLYLKSSWLNPFFLRQELDKKLKTFSKLLAIHNRRYKHYDGQIMTQLQI